MIALLRSTDGNPDSRFEKYVDFLTKKNIPHVTMCWDRKGNKEATSSKLYYKKNSEYGKRYGNIGGLFGFNKFLFKNLWRMREHYKVIHACDFDTVLPATLIHILCGKKVIYDIFDWYVDSRSIKGLFKYFVYALEWLNIKCASAIIICEPERKKQIIFEPKIMWILPNIPNFAEQLPKHKKNDQLTIGYVGILAGGRGLNNILSYAISHDDIRLKVGGFGPLEKQFKEASDKCSNIEFYGSLPYKEALQLLNSVDIIYACYEKVNPNHILAAPNKYYEGLYLAHPIITTSGTIVGEKTEKFQTGFTIEEDYRDLENLFKNITIDQIDEYGLNANNLWNKHFRTYVNDFLEEKYLPYILKQ